MPRYSYHCDKCRKAFEVIHSIKEKLEICEECEGPLVRIPSQTFIRSKPTGEPLKRQVGDLVKDHIEESRKELQKEQKRIGSEEYKK
jgi:putative FmdB family regulatory protein|tara:strand:- start:194 stop:454 length:261 start_codon:yes stop_codon:yes gene_type:complete